MPETNAQPKRGIPADDHPGVRAAIEAMVESRRQVELTQKAPGDGSPGAFSFPHAHQRISD